MGTRDMTCRLIEAAENGLVEWETIARECLAQMSEDEAEDVATALELDEDE